MAESIMIQEEDVRKLADLSRIYCTNEDIKKMQQNLLHIFDWISLLNEVDVSNIPPMTGVELAGLKRHPDKVQDGGIQDKILSNVPEKSFGMFSVPKVIE